MHPKSCTFPMSRPPRTCANWPFSGSASGPALPPALSGQGGAGPAHRGHLEMTVFLPPEVKGTHMSRFVEILESRGRHWTWRVCVI
jgi:hypothetical protein